MEWLPSWWSARVIAVRSFPPTTQLPASQPQPNADFVATNGTITLGVGQFSALIKVPLVNDATPEPEETFGITLSNPVGGASLGSPDVVTVRLQDDDPAQRGMFRFQSATYNVSEGSQDLFVRVERVGGTNGPVSVDFATIDGSALAGQDFAATNGTLVFGDTETLKSFNLRLVSDPPNDGFKMLTLALSAPGGGAALTNPSSTAVTINDQAGTLSACNEASLRAAIGVGGTVTMACDGTIFLTSPLVLSNGVRMDAAGHNVTLSGGGSNRLFHVTTGVVLELLGLTLVDGSAQGTNGGIVQAGGVGAGGAIYNDGGTVRALGCTLLRNEGPRWHGRGFP